jgi:hypothetical protein
VTGADRARLIQPGEQLITRSGRKITEEMITAWADEAERGYELAPRGRCSACSQILPGVLVPEPYLGFVELSPHPHPRAYPFQQCTGSRSLFRAVMRPRA